VEGIVMDLLGKSESGKVGDSAKSLDRIFGSTASGCYRLSHLMAFD